MNLQDRKNRDVATIASIVRIILVIGVIAALIYGGLKAFFFLLPIVIGLVLATASVTISKWLVRQFQRLPMVQPKPSSIGKNHFQRGLSVFLYILLFIFMGFLLSFVVTFIIRILSTLSREIPAWMGETSIIDHLMREISAISQNLGNIFDSDALQSIRESLQNLQSSIISSLPQVVTRMLSIITGLFSSLPRVILVSVITVLSGFYFIVQTERLYRLALRIVPDRNLVRKVFVLIHSLTLTLFRLMGGYLVLLFITFIEAYIGYLIIGIDSPLTWAIVTGIVDLLPILGISFTMIPMSIVYLVSGDALMGIGILILFIAMTVLRRLIEPAIIGNAMRLHPLMTILSMIIGIAVMGLGGLLVGPLVFFIAKEIYDTFEVEKKLRTAIGDMLAKSGDKDEPNPA